MISHSHSSRARRFFFVWLAVFSVGVSTLSAATFTVISNSDTYSDPQNPPSGTLRWAILQANHQPGFDTINFNIPANANGGAAVKTIVLQGSSFLDELYVSGPVLLDATSQPSYAGSPRIEINCNGRNQAFFLSGSGGITIRGFIMNRFNAVGITVYPGSNGDTIIDNWIGTDQTGRGTFPSNLYPQGIAVQSSYNVIRNNVVSGVDNAIVVGFDIGSPIWDARCVLNLLSDNKVGTDPTGTIAVGNTGDGIFLSAGAAYNWIGPNNVLSGQASAGVEMLHSSVQFNVVFGNFIGTDITGSYRIGNGGEGILISNGSNRNCVGGAAGRNIISGNDIAGIVIGNAGSFYSGIGNWIQENYIGSDATASVAIPNGDGIVIGTNRSYWNTIEKNLIVGNSRTGIVLQDTLSNWVENNWIGVRWDGLRMGNARDGVFVCDSYYNTVISNNIQFNGFGDPIYAGWAGIRLGGASANNGFWNNVVANNLNNP